MQCVPRAASSKSGDDRSKSVEIGSVIYTYRSIGCKDVSKIFNYKLKHNVVIVFCHTNLCILCFLQVFLMIRTFCLVECELSS